jgi:putative transposase
LTSTALASGSSRSAARCRFAPSAYRRHAARQRDPTLLPARAVRDAQLLAQVQRVYDQNLRVYGADKVWRQLRREGTGVARCTVEP